jgi:type II secretory pathway predicted ATPase ExeA
MYTAVFGFRHLPFAGAPPSTQLFSCTHLDELHSRLSYLVEHRSIGLLTGEPGSGKSTALRRLRDQVHPEQVRILYLHDTVISPRDFCCQIAFELGLEPSWSRAQTLRAIHQEIRRLDAERRLTVLLVVDEAQGLRPDVLALLPVLTSFEWDGAGRLALLLAGQTGLRQTLRLAHLEPLAQRITVRYALRGFDRETTAAYVEHRLERAGVSRPLFTETAIEALFTASQGVMRRIDTLAHHALAVVATQGAKLVEAEHVVHAAEEIRT